MPKLDRSGLGLLLSAGVAAWIVENDPFGVQEVQGKRASALNMPSLRKAPARPPCLLRPRLAAPGGAALPGKRRPPGRPATASAARARRQSSRRFHRLLAHAGKEKGSIFDALEDLDYQECLDKCVAISKA